MAALGHYSGYLEASGYERKAILVHFSSILKTSNTDLVLSSKVADCSFKAKLFYFLIQCPQSLPESAGEEIKIKIRKNKNILLKIYILYKFNLSIFLKMLMILNTYLDWQNLNIYV